MVSRASLVILVLTTVGCVSYRPAPVDLKAQAQGLQARRLSDEGLRAYLERLSGRPEPVWPRPSWDFRALTVAALYHSPLLAGARADLARARADALAAGLRADPSLALSGEYQRNAGPGISPWTYGPSLELPLTVAGKRGIRQAQAAERVRESRLRLEGACWRVRSDLRAALVGWQGAAARTAAAQRLAGARGETLGAVEAARAAGEASGPDAESARAEAEAARLALAGARQAEAQARTGLAAALGLPEAALERVAIDELPAPAEEPSGLEGAREAALTGRSDLLADLAAYAASDQALRLAVAEQYPDLRLSPGHLWDQGALRWQLGLALALPLLNRNRGGIAQAEAERAAAGERLLAAQESVLHEVEGSTSAYRQALAAQASARAQSEARRSAAASARAALEAGEEDRLTVALADAGLAAAELDEIAAAQELQGALGRLEDALQRPLSPPDPLPPVSTLEVR